FFLVSNRTDQARESLQRWLKSAFAHRIWIFNRDGRLEIALHKDEKGQVRRRQNLESVVELNEPLLKAIKDKDTIHVVDFAQEEKVSHMELSVFTKIYG